MRKLFFLYFFLVVTVLLPWACSDNNSPSNPSGPSLGGLGGTPTFTGTIPTATDTPTLTPTGIAPSTPTPTWTFTTPKPYLNNYRTSAAPNGMYFDAGSNLLTVAEAQTQSGTTITAVEEFGVGGGGANLVLPPGVANIYAQGQATPYILIPASPTPEVVTYGGTYGYPMGAVSSNGTIAVLDSPPGGSATLFVEDNFYYWPPADVAGPFMNWTNGFSGATFRNPKGLTADPTGNIYVADTGNGYVDWFGRGNGPLGSSPAWFGRWNGPGAGFGPGTTFKSPVAVACDNSGNVYVADSGPFVIGGVTTSMVQVFSSGGTTILGSFTLAANCVVNGITADSLGDFYVTDTSNGEVEEYQMMPYPFVNGSPSTQCGMVTAWGDPHSYHEFQPYTPSCLQFIGSYVIVGDAGNPFLNIFGP